MTSRPRVLIEDWLPLVELGIESRREAAPIPGQFPKLKTLHVWWARRPLAACAGAVLGSLMPAHSQELAAAFPQASELQNEAGYRAWFLRLCGVLGDPVAAKQRIAAADAAGVKLGAKAYGYKQAFKNSPSDPDLELLHDVLRHTWGREVTVVDPSAGGGSIPYEASRYGLASTANDLNPVAAATLVGGLSIPVAWGLGIGDDLRSWGHLLVSRVTERLANFFEQPADEPPSDNNSYIFARTIACPRTGKPVPLSRTGGSPRAR